MCLGRFWFLKLASKRIVRVQSKPKSTTGPVRLTSTHSRRQRCSSVCVYFATAVQSERIIYIYGTCLGLCAPTRADSFCRSSLSGFRCASYSDRHHSSVRLRINSIRLATCARWRERDTRLLPATLSSNRCLKQSVTSMRVTTYFDPYVLLASLPLLSNATDSLQTDRLRSCPSLALTEILYALDKATGSLLSHDARTADSLRAGLRSSLWSGSPAPATRTSQLSTDPRFNRTEPVSRA